MEKRVSKVEALPRLAPEFRVAAYARVSSEKDAMRHSLSAQVSYYSNLIQSHPGWQYAGVYADEERSYPALLDQKNASIIVFMA